MEIHQHPAVLCFGVSVVSGRSCRDRLFNIIVQDYIK